MFSYHCLNPIAEVGLDQFTTDYKKVDTPEEAEAILVRSAAMHEMTFSNRLEAIARAGAGVNNIPLERCAKEGIVVFNTPGANANGVKELVFAGMLLASRDIVGGIEWVKSVSDEADIAKMAEKQNCTLPNLYLLALAAAACHCCKSPASRKGKVSAVSQSAVCLWCVKILRL